MKGRKTKIRNIPNNFVFKKLLYLYSIFILFRVGYCTAFYMSQNKLIYDMFFP